MDTVLNLRANFILGAHLEMMMPFCLSKLGILVVLLLESRNTAKYSTMYNSLCHHQEPIVPVLKDTEEREGQNIQVRSRQD